jgi:hypothetical protein
MALAQANKLFGYYLVLILLAVLGVGFDTVMFLGKILSRWTRARDARPRAMADLARRDD